MADDGILHMLVLDGDGGAHVPGLSEISSLLKSHDLAWIHLDAKHPKSREWLESEIRYLDDLIVDALLADETRPRMLEHENGILLILRGMNFAKDADPEDMVSLRLWIDPHRIISMQRRHVTAVEEIAKRLKDKQGPASAGDFLSLLTQLLFERMEPVLSELDEKTDDVEERILESPEAEERQEIIELRKEAIIYKRYLLPQRDVLSSLRNSTLSWIDPLNKREMQETLDRIVRYIEDLDELRERAQIIKDELANALSDRMNRNMYVLSVIAAIFLPLGFLTGLLGINVGGIPGADSPDAFWVFVVMLAALVAAQVTLFKKMKWF